jgi:hypothetical protein
MIPAGKNLLHAIEAGLSGLGGRWLAAINTDGEAVGAVIRAKSGTYQLMFRDPPDECDDQFRERAAEYKAVALLMGDWQQPLAEARDKVEALDGAIEMARAMTADANAKITELTETNAQLWTMVERSLRILTKMNDRLTAAGGPAPTRAT